MRVVQVSTYETVGGAGRSALRLHGALREAGVDSVVLARHRTGADPTVVIPGTRAQRLASLVAPSAEALLLRWAGAAREPFSAPFLPDAIPTEVRRLGADLVNLHWISHSFVGVRSVARFGVPVVWTLHDSWAFTGGCHVPGDCVRYRDSCGACPALESTREHDLSRWLWNRKRRAWRPVELTVVTPSRWLAEKARESSLLRDCRVEVIPNSVSLDRYRDVARPEARRLLGVPDDGRSIVLFGAYGGVGAANKGFDLLVEALRELAQEGEVPVRLLLVGSPSPPDVSGLPVTSLGILSDDVAIALAIACADVVAVPSRQENLPNGILEAQACARPVVAFRVGGIPEMLDGENGVLVEPFDVAGLARGLRSVLSDPERWKRMSMAARAHAEAHYRPRLQARRYADLYAELTASRGT